MASVLRDLRQNVSAIFHNSGGGITKCLKFGNNIRYIKDNLFDTPPIFTHIANIAKLSPREMCRVYNMGHRMEIVCDSDVSGQIIDISKSFNVDAQVIGRTEVISGPNQIFIQLPDGTKVDFRDSDLLRND